PPFGHLLPQGEKGTSRYFNKKAPEHAGASGLFGRQKVQRHAIDAVAQAGWGWTVREHMAQMAAAGGAMAFRAAHAVAGVGGGFHRTRQRVIKARPAGAALEFQR